MTDSELSRRTFNAKEYVKTAAAGCSTIEELDKYRQKMKQLGDRNAQELKKNVYSNYKYYIETSKEISKIETEVSDLGNVMASQQEILDKVARVFGNSGKDTDGGGGSSSEKVDPTPILALVDGLVAYDPLVVGEIQWQGRLVDVDPITFETVHVFVAYVLEKALVLTEPSSGNGSENTKNECVSIEPLTDLQVTTVENSQIHNALKISDSICFHVYLAPTPADKRKLLSILRNSATVKVDVLSTSDFEGIDPWLLDIGQDLEVLITQRAFNDAKNLIQNGYKSVNGIINEVARKSVRAHIDARKDKLTAVLCKELERFELRKYAVNAIVNILIALNENDKACTKFLENRSLAISREIKNLKMEGATEIYILKLSRLFFSFCRDSIIEFGSLFPMNERKSAFMDWLREEIDKYVNIFIRQVLQSSTNTFQNISNCVEIACSNCRLLVDVGVDVEFCVWDSLESMLIDVINDEGKNWSSIISQAFASETWEPHQFHSRHEMRLFGDALMKLGVQHPEDYLEDGQSVLCDVTMLFATTADEFTRSACKLYNPKILTTLVSWIIKLFVTYMNKLEKVYNGKHIFQSNAVFVMDFILPRAIVAFRERTGALLQELDQLENDVATTWHTMTKAKANVKK